MARIVDVDLPIFDPLSYTNLGAATAEALFERKPVPMSQLPHFRGEGVYAIYYCGDFKPYKVISEANADDQWAMPIYVGKADPPGAREGSKTIVPEQGKSQSMVCQERALRDRLQGHVRSIEAATSTLNIEHFWCRFLLVNQVWVGLAETMMISRFTPIWNTPINGFGNNAPGGGREGQVRSRWDTVHPGRRAAEKLPPRPEPRSVIEDEIRQILAARRAVPPPAMFEAEGDAEV